MISTQTILLYAVGVFALMLVGILFTILDFWKADVNEEKRPSPEPQFNETSVQDDKC